MADRDVAFVGSIPQNSAVAANVAAEPGDRPVRAPRRALVFSAHRPA